LPAVGLFLLVRYRGSHRSHRIKKSARDAMFIMEDPHRREEFFAFIAAIAKN
jgi:hypothetical protein